MRRKRLLMNGNKQSRRINRNKTKKWKWSKKDENEQKFIGERVKDRKILILVWKSNVQYRNRSGMLGNKIMNQFTVKHIHTKDNRKSRLGDWSWIMNLMGSKNCNSGKEKLNHQKKLDTRIVKQLEKE